MKGRAGQNMSTSKAEGNRQDKSEGRKGGAKGVQRQAIVECKPRAMAG